MITLPPGFDYALLISDYFSVVLPFIPVIVLLVGYRILMKTLNRV